MTLKSRVKIKPIKRYDPIRWEEIIKAPLPPPTIEEKHVPVEVLKFATEPQSFDEFIGQDSSKEVLNYIIEASIKSQNAIPNILLTGGYGHGKTTLAKLITKRLDKRFRLIDGALAESVLSVPDPNTIYIVDEIHNIPPVLADSLNILIDGGFLHIIGCTTSPGKLAAPFRSRFRQIFLDDYTQEDISTIVSNAAKKASLLLEKEGLSHLSTRSKLNPRIALSILSFLWEISIVEDLKEITTEKVLFALDSLRVDSDGLTELDRKYLAALSYESPVGLRHIMSILSLDSSTIEEQIEPFLLKKGFIERTSRGRLRTL